MVRLHRVARFARVASLLAVLLVTAAAAGAAPGQRSPVDLNRHQSPDWLSAESAAALDVGFDVLLPSFVPAPFGGEPSISAYPGFYRLYWFIPGTPPTFLQITGEVGGVIPAYSEYDRNNQIFVNATVQGYGAYHDLTSIYDRVYWQAGEVVYTVDSQGLAGTDSLSLANSLGVLALSSGVDDSSELPNDDGSETGVVPGEGVAPSLSVPANVPSGETAAIVVDGVSGAMLTADAGLFPASGSDSLTELDATTVAWQAPATETDVSVLFVLLNPTNGDWLATGETVVAAVPAPAPEAEQEAAPVEAEAPAEQNGDEESAGSAPAPTATRALTSDGTGAGSVGYTLALVGDGTGGSRAPAEGEEPASSSNIQEEQPGDLTGIGTEATQAALPTESSDGDDGEDAGSTQTPEPEEQPRPTGTSEASPTPESTSTPGPSPTATLAPTTGLNGLVSRVIGPDGGELASPDGATLTIPAGALTEDATVTIVPVADTKLPVVSDVEFVPGSAFDVSVATATGESVEQLQEPATLRIDVPQDQWRDGMTLYRIEGMEATSLDGANLDDAGVSAETDHFSRFVAGLPIATESDRRDPLPFIIAALGILAVLLLIVGYVTAQQRRRPRAITPRSRRYR
ncbi:MAG: hypothetical protein ACRDJH_23275 [Thermomicrobiales bacterium]